MKTLLHCNECEAIFEGSTQAIGKSHLHASLTPVACHGEIELAVVAKLPLENGPGHKPEVLAAALAIKNEYIRRVENLKYALHDGWWVGDTTRIQQVAPGVYELHYRDNSGGQVSNSLLGLVVEGTEGVRQYTATDLIVVQRS